MREDDAPVRAADRPRRLDVFEVARDQCLAAHEAAVGDPPEDADGDIEVAQPRPEQRHQGDDEDEEGEGEQDIDDAHDGVVRLAAEVPGGDAEQAPGDKGEEHGEEADLKVQPRAEDDPAQFVAPEVVRAEQMAVAEWRGEGVAEVLLDRVIRREQRGEERDEQDESRAESARGAACPGCSGAG